MSSRGGEPTSTLLACSPGEGDPFRTNRRFHLLAEGQPATRLSTAFDSVTLYGFDPDERPDIYGKVGNAGVSVATLDDMKALYAGFDLCDPTTSVSMTINGPAPTILAMFLNTAIDQRLERFAEEHGRPPSDDEAADLREWVLRNVRGTVQADILKEDQGQNTCIFSTEFSLGVMADIQEWFVEHEVRRFYSVSISGYHIAEAGANPISQLAFTLANGFTYVESYLARGHGDRRLRPQPVVLLLQRHGPGVLGARARRPAHLGHHHARPVRRRRAEPEAEVPRADVGPVTARAGDGLQRRAHHAAGADRPLRRLQQPPHQRLRRGGRRRRPRSRCGEPLAIQLIINQEWGISLNENPNQGSFLIEELTDLVEEAVLVELERISERGGVLGAMETGYQRGRIQDESMLYERRKHDGSLPIVGVNTFRNPHPEPEPVSVPLARSTEEEKRSQIERLRDFQARHADQRPAMIERLQSAALAGENLFAVLIDAVRVCTLGEITHALFDVGGRYRRNV